MVVTNNCPQVVSINVFEKDLQLIQLELVTGSEALHDIRMSMST